MSKENDVKDEDVRDLREMKGLLEDFLKAFKELMTRGTEFEKRIGINQLIGLLMLCEETAKKNRIEFGVDYEKFHEVLTQKKSPFQADFKEIDEMLADFGKQVVPAAKKVLQGKKVIENKVSRKKQMERKFRSRQ